MNTLPEDIEALFHKRLAQTSDKPYGIHLKRAEGCFVWDINDKKYVDLVSGISVSNIGHRHPLVINAIQRQSEKYLHTMVFGEYVQPVQVNLADNLAKMLPEALDCSYLVNSGTEAIEAALKLAKRHTGRSKIVSFRKSYHGSTHGSLSVSGNEEKKDAFRPLLPDVHFIDLNDSHSLTVIDESAAAVILEPIQGDAGVKIPNKEYLLALRARCTKVGAMLIFDEIQCGLGRTGKMFAFEHFDVHPDILCLAKSLGGGLPIGAMISSQHIMDDFKSSPALGHITTFGGNPLSCAASIANLKVLQTEISMKEVEAKGKLFKSLLIHDKIIELRQIGLMIAVDLESEEELSNLIDLCKDQGVIIYRFLSHPFSFRISPPLIISDELIKQSVEVIIKCLDRL